ncbi:hypothetical protein BC937DRAFT_94639 [Endogone sp. FLAS-F59071]|nr:hypothetical protein BC937DRAFT_94639 [Endogone sp. FLAS-F59071]|eukprot:RUS13881.1 hypothetical protein BC937DRAFT_94639 [Endogone sp. FLAS-F59071]
MNIVSEKVILAFFHANPDEERSSRPEKCGEIEHSPEEINIIGDHLRRASLDSSSDINRLLERSIPIQAAAIPSPTPSQPVRIFQILDTNTRRLLFTWPDPHYSESDIYRKEGGWPVQQEGYRPEEFARLVQNAGLGSQGLSPTSSSSAPYQIAGGNTGASCMGRTDLKYTLPQSHGPAHMVEGVMIPYGTITFASFQVSVMAVQGLPNASHGGRQSTSSPPFGPSGTPGQNIQDTRSYQHIYEDGARLLGTYSPNNSHPPMDETPVSSPLPNGQRVNRVNHSNSSFPYHSPYSHASDTQYAQYPSHSQSYFPSYDDQNPANTRIPYVRRISPPQPLPSHQQSPTASSVLDPPPTVSPTNPLIPYARRVSPPTSQQFSLPPTSVYPPYEDGHAQPVNPIPRIPYARHTSPLLVPPPIQQQQQQFQTAPQAVPYQFGTNGQVAHRQYAPPSPREVERNSGNGSVGPKKFCESCHTDSSPEWRRGPTGHKTLCNACGLRYSRSVARQGKAAQQQQQIRASRAILAPGSGNPMISNTDSYPQYPHSESYGNIPPNPAYPRQSPQAPPLVNPPSQSSAHRYHPYSGPVNNHNGHPPPSRSSASSSPMALPLPPPQLPSVAPFHHIITTTERVPSEGPGLVPQTTIIHHHHHYHTGPPMPVSNPPPPGGMISMPPSLGGLGSGRGPENDLYAPTPRKNDR